MSDPTRLPDWIAELLGQAARWRLLGLLFEPPEGDWRDELTSLAAEAGDDELAAAAEEARREADAGLYHSTFGPGGPVPPREVSYRRTVHPGRFLAEISDQYRAFAYTPRIPETPDHVAVETGFVAYLRLKEAYAHACARPERAAQCRSAADRFVAEHLGAMAPAFAELLGRSKTPYLAGAGAVLVAYVGPQPAPPGRDAAALALCDDECSCG